MKQFNKSSLTFRRPSKGKITLMTNSNRPLKPQKGHPLHMQFSYIKKQQVQMKSTEMILENWEPLLARELMLLLGLQITK